MKKKITESQLRNIIRKSLCEAMNIDADDYNNYLKQSGNITEKHDTEQIKDKNIQKKS